MIDQTIYNELMDLFTIEELRKIFSCFEITMKEDIDILEEYLITGDNSRLRGMTHSIIGSALSFGLIPLGESAKTLNSAVKHKTLVVDEVNDLILKINSTILWLKLNIINNV